MRKALLHLTSPSIAATLQDSITTLKPLPRTLRGPLLSLRRADTRRPHAWWTSILPATGRCSASPRSPSTPFTAVGPARKPACLYLASALFGLGPRELMMAAQAGAGREVPPGRAAWGELPESVLNALLATAAPGNHTAGERGARQRTHACALRQKIGEPVAAAVWPPQRLRFLPRDLLDGLWRYSFGS